MSNNATYKNEAYFVPPIVAEHRLARDYGTVNIGYEGLSTWIHLIMDIGSRMGMQLDPHTINAALLANSYNDADQGGVDPIASLSAALLPLLGVSLATRQVLGLPNANF